MRFVEVMSFVLQRRHRRGALRLGARGLFRLEALDRDTQSWRLTLMHGLRGCAQAAVPRALPPAPKKEQKKAPSAFGAAAKPVRVTCLKLLQLAWCLASGRVIFLT